ncbi:MAG: lamin tail domain-containing protein, partial [Flavobacterium sp.]|nr:lamin tail domain-containing protein [Flavobacterium sp.]
MNKTFKNPVNFILLLFLLFSISIFSQNLLFNGDFESGGNGVGFNLNGAGYTLLTPPYSGATVAGNYAFTTNPQPLNTAFFISGGDHTTGTGNMMVIDGNTTGGQQRFWRAGNTGGGVCGLTVGVTYTFRYWIKSVATTVVDNATRADIGVQFNNVSTFSLITGSALAPLPAAGWQQVVYSFVPSNACVNIELFNNNTNAVGNDFAVDDFAVLAPLQPLTISYSSTNSSCFNANDASISVYGNGGVQPYVSYSISGPVNATNSSGVFSNLLPGTYALSVTDSNTPPSVVSLSNIILTQPNGLAISPDVEICLSNSTTLSVSGGNSYNWTASPADPSLITPTSSTPTVSPSQTTTYTVTSTVSTTQNLIFNGDFSQGNTGFTTDYFYTPLNPSGGQKIYTVAPNSQTWFFGFSNCVDHTSGTGNMMIVDGSTFNGGNDKVWCQTVSVQPGQTYTFSYWVQTIALPNPANIEVLINGVSVGQAFAPGTSCLWAQRSYTWNSGTNTTAEICIYDRVTTVGGNDFALDDISFTNTTTCDLSESVTVTVTTANPIVGFTYDTPICQSNPATFLPNLATDFTTGGVFSATPSGLSINPSTGAISPSLSTPGIYEVLYVITANACLNGASSTFTVEIKPIPQTPDVLVTSQPNCIINVGSIEVLNPLTGTPPPTNLFISEVTDEDVGALTYVEIFNGTGNPVNLANYKIKIYNNGNAFSSCEIPLVGTLANNSVFVVSVGSAVNQGGVVPNLVVASCAGINNNDNIRLTTNTDVEIDLWGRTDGVAFTPSNLPGYTYRRLNNSNPPSLVWNPSDWSSIDPQDYSNVGAYQFLTSTYEYSVDGVNYQSSAIFTGLTPGTYSVTVLDTTTGCVSNATTVVIDPIPSGPDAPTFSVVSQPNCLVATGSISVNSPIASNFEYSIDGVAYQTQTLFTGLPSGSYSLTVRNTITGCISDVTAVVITSNDNVPTPTFAFTSQPTCIIASGSFEVLSPLGTNYQYAIDGINYQPSVTFSGLSSGNYTLTVLDVVTGCVSSSVNVVINPIPANPNAPTLSVQQPTCFQPLGSIQVQTPVGTNFSYALNGGAFQQSPIFSGLVPGNYSVTVQDVTTGCVSTPTAQVINNLPPNPSVPTFQVFQAGCANITGGIEITNPLGNSFLYSINNGVFQTSPTFTNLPVGTYEVVVQDAVTGCISNPAFFEIVLLDFDVIANTPTPLTYCDPNNDNVGIFDLTSVANQVTGGAATSIVTYHETFTDADLGVTP